MNTAADNPARAGGPKGRPFHITVRTLAGHSDKQAVRPTDTVADVTNEAVAHFVRHGQLVAGSYALTLPRAGNSAELDPTAALGDVGVVEDDVLVLVSREPQVDGS